MKQIKSFLAWLIAIQVLQMSVLLGWLFRGKSAVYGTNDDSLIASIASGEATGAPDPHLIFIQPIFSYPIVLLERILDSYSGYATFLIFISTLSFSAVIALLISNRKLNIYNFIFWLIFDLIFQSWFALNPTYTGASLFAAGASASIMMYIFNNQVAENLKLIKFLLIVSSFLIILCFGIRKEGVFIFLILIIPSLIIKNKWVRKNYKITPFFIIPITIFYFLNGFAYNKIYSKNEWASFMEMNNLRHQIQLRAPEKYLVNNLVELGWSKETYLMFLKFRLLDSEQMNANKMLQILTSTNDYVGPKSIFNVDKNQLFKNIRIALNPWTWIIKVQIYMILLFGILHFRAKVLTDYVCSISMLLISSGILLTILSAGYQLPERITLNLLATISMVILVHSVQFQNTKKLYSGTFSISLLFILIFIARDSYNRLSIETYAREGLYRTWQAYSNQQSNALGNLKNQIVISNASGIKAHWRFPYSNLESIDPRHKTIILGWQNLSPISQKQFKQQGLDIKNFPRSVVNSNIYWVDATDSINDSTKYFSQFVTERLTYTDEGPVGNDEYHFYRIRTNE